MIRHGFFNFVIDCIVMKKGTGFEKFQKGKKSGAALKEEIRQEKKKITKERKEYFENKRREVAEARNNPTHSPAKITRSRPRTS